MAAGGAWAWRSSGRRVVAEVQADLAKAFDHVDRGDLWAKAVGAKYPLAVLSLTTAAYRMGAEAGAWQAAPAASTGKQGGRPWLACGHT